MHIFTITHSEATAYIAKVQAGELEFDEGKLSIALQTVGNPTTPTEFRRFMRAAGRVERRRPGFVVCTPTGSGRNR